MMADPSINIYDELCSYNIQIYKRWSTDIEDMLINKYNENEIICILVRNPFRGHKKRKT